MSSEKETILSWLARQTFSADVLDFRFVLEQAARQALGKSEIEAEQFASNPRVARYWNVLVESLDTERRLGLFPSYRIIDEHSRQLVCCAGESIGSKSSRAIALRPVILGSIDAMTSRMFEGLAGEWLSTAGAHRVVVTQASGDDGIDAFGLMWARRRCHIWGRPGGLRIVVQSKMYASRVAVDKATLFAKTLDDIRASRSSLVSEVPDWFLASHSPIVGVVVGHSGFQSGARDKCREEGIVALESIDIAQALSLCRKYQNLRPADIKSRLQEAAMSWAPEPPKNQ